jgi:1-acyl-sn-glycerol-3-phosphate acyltransferase
VVFDIKMVYPLTKIFSGIIIKPFTRKVIGKVNLPKTPFIAAANHASFADDFLLNYHIMYASKRKFRIFVNSRFYKSRLIKAYLDHYNCIPVDVSKDVKNKEKRKKTNESAFKLAIKALKQGYNFHIFPEGGRSSDGKLKKAKLGVARVSLEAKVPVVPIGIIGSHEILPKGKKFPRLKRADIIIGKPLNFEKYNGKDYKTLEEVTRIIMKEIAKLTNQKYIY